MVVDHPSKLATNLSVHQNTDDVHYFVVDQIHPLYWLLWLSAPRFLGAKRDFTPALLKLDRLGDEPQRRLDYSRGNMLDHFIQFGRGGTIAGKNSHPTGDRFEIEG